MLPEIIRESQNKSYNTRSGKISTTDVKGVLKHLKRFKNAQKGSESKRQSRVNKSLENKPIQDMNQRNLKSNSIIASQTFELSSKTKGMVWIAKSIICVHAIEKSKHKFKSSPSKNNIPSNSQLKILAKSDPVPSQLQNKLGKPVPSKIYRIDSKPVKDHKLHKSVDKLNSSTLRSHSKKFNNFILNLEHQNQGNLNTIISK